MKNKNVAPSFWKKLVYFSFQTNLFIMKSFLFLFTADMLVQSLEFTAGILVLRWLKLFITKVVHGEFIFPFSNSVFYMHQCIMHAWQKIREHMSYGMYQEQH
jgi:hypothetical protein